MHVCTKNRKNGPVDSRLGQVTTRNKFDLATVTIRANAVKFPTLFCQIDWLLFTNEQHMHAYTHSGELESGVTRHG